MSEAICPGCRQPIIAIQDPDVCREQWPEVAWHRVCAQEAGICHYSTDAFGQLLRDLNVTQEQWERGHRSIMPPQKSGDLLPIEQI